MLPSGIVKVVLSLIFGTTNVRISKTLSTLAR